MSIRRRVVVRSLSACLVAAFCLGTSAGAEETSAASVDPAFARIKADYQTQTKKAGGTWYSYITALDDRGTMRRVVADKPDTVVSAYSVNKLAVAVAVMDKVDRGELRLDQKLDLPADIILGGSGFYHLQPVHGDDLTLANIMVAMLLVSDNTSVRMFGRVVPGPEINHILAKKGFTDTRVEPLPDNPNRFYLGKTTPRETHRLLLGIAEKTLLSDKSSDFLLDIMSSNDGYTDGARRNMSSQERSRFATKYGAVGDTRNDVGIIFDRTGAPSLVYAFFANKLADPDNYGATNPAVEAHAVLGRTMFDAVADKVDPNPKARHPIKQLAPEGGG